MRARGRYSAEDDQTYSVRELQKDLEDEIANLRDENTDRKEKIRKLKKQVSDLRKENLSLNILYFTNFNHKKTERFFNNLPLLNNEN